MTQLNPLPWRIADDMDALKGRLEIILEDIRLLNRPVPPKAITRAKSMRDLLDRIIKESEQRNAMEDVG